eukprot:4103682-Alexandrium_andersonii.AAC.1
MSASLVGSEMCIRDSASPDANRRLEGSRFERKVPHGSAQLHMQAGVPACCLLYTSDAADDM